MVLTVIILYLGVILYLGIPKRRAPVATVSEHVVAGRSLGLAPIFFIGVAEFYSAGTFLGFPGWAYRHGAPVLFSLVAVALSAMMAFWLGPKIWRAGKQLGLLTQAQFLSTRYHSRSLGALAAVVAVLSLIANLTLQMMGAGYIFEVSTRGQIPYWFGSLIAFAVVAVYVVLGGLRSISKVAIFKGLFMLAIIVTVATAVVTRHFSGVAEMYDALARHHPEHLILPGSEGFFGYVFWSTSILISFVSINMGPYLFVNFYSAQEPRLIRKQAVIAPVYALAIYVVLLVGFAGVLVKPDLAEADTVMVEMIMDFAPPWLLGLFCAGGLSAAMVSGSAMSLAAASTVGNDLLKPLIKMEDWQLKRMIQLLILVFIALAYAFSISKPATITYISLMALGIGAQFFPLVISAFYIRRATGAGAAAGLFAGIVTLGWFTFGPTPNPYGIHGGLIGMLVNVVVFALVGCFSPRSPEAIVDIFRRAAQEPLAAVIHWEKRFVLAMLIVAGAAVWPAVAMANRIHPVLAGHPLFIVYSVSFAFTVMLLLAVSYRASRAVSAPIEEAVDAA